MMVSWRRGEGVVAVVNGWRWIARGTLGRENRIRVGVVTAERSSPMWSVNSQIGGEEGENVAGENDEPGLCLEKLLEQQQSGQPGLPLHPEALS